MTRSTDQATVFKEMSASLARLTSAYYNLPVPRTIDEQEAHAAVGAAVAELHASVARATS